VKTAEQLLARYANDDQVVRREFACADDGHRHLVLQIGIRKGHHFTKPKTKAEMGDIKRGRDDIPRWI